MAMSVTDNRSTRTRPGMSAKRRTELSSDQIPSLHQFKGSYVYQWRLFEEWCRESGRQPFPAVPEDVSAYIDWRSSAGARPSTLRVITSAIARLHLDAGYSNPCEGEVDQRVMAIVRSHGPAPRRSVPLDLFAYLAIRETAHLPRISRGGRLESEESARRRGAYDIAVIGLMRDARLRVKETAHIRWADIEHSGTALSGYGTVAVRDADRPGEPEYRYLSKDTMRLLAEIRGTAGDDERIITLQPKQLTTRVAAAARQAGLGEGYSAASPRLGMLLDLETIGVVFIGAHVTDSLRSDDSS